MGKSQSMLTALEIRNITLLSSVLCLCEVRNYLSKRPDIQICPDEINLHCILLSSQVSVFPCSLTSLLDPGLMQHLPTCLRCTTVGTLMSIFPALYSLHFFIPLSSPNLSVLVLAAAITVIV